VQHSPSDAIIQRVPLIILNAIYAIVEFIVARKRRVNVWGWTLATLTPFFGLFVSAIFFLTTLLSILDRLNALESDYVGKAFA
jgi:hypothetical protein